MSRDRCPEVALSFEEELDAYEAAVDAADLFDRVPAEEGPARRFDAVGYWRRNLGTGLASVRRARPAP